MGGKLKVAEWHLRKCRDGCWPEREQSDESPARWSPVLSRSWGHGTAYLAAGIGQRILWEASEQVTRPWLASRRDMQELSKVPVWEKLEPKYKDTRLISDRCARCGSGRLPKGTPRCTAKVRVRTAASWLYASNQATCPEVFRSSTRSSPKSQTREAHSSLDLVLWAGYFVLPNPHHATGLDLKSKWDFPNL